MCHDGRPRYDRQRQYLISELTLARSLCNVKRSGQTTWKTCLPRLEHMLVREVLPRCVGQSSYECLVSISIASGLIP